MQSRLYYKCKANYTINTEGEKLKTKIKQLRKERKLSQEELALEVGTTRQTITSIEVGKYTASLVLAYKIAHYFGLTIEEVFEFTDVEEE
jgi:putative transcriptional regulator